LAVLLTMNATRGAAAAACTASARASSTSTVIGFSISTCLPAARNAPERDGGARGARAAFHRMKSRRHKPRRVARDDAARDGARLDHDA
jgi:hypothetical protein